MTAQQIADRVLLDDGRTLTPERVAKLKSLCQRMRVDLAAVVALLPAEMQQQIAEAR